MGSLGVPELIIIFVVALIVFGPRKLPELGKSLGKGIAEFKKASNELQNTLEQEIRNEEQQKVVAPAPQAVAQAAAVAEHAAQSTESHAPADTVARGEQTH